MKMDMGVSTVLFIVFWHWAADFVMQTHWQATNKSTNNIALLEHVTMYSGLWLIPMTYLLGKDLALLFVLITFAAHFTTDYFTSRLNTKLYKAGKIHNFFVSIGFDQFLHYTQLLLTYALLKAG